MLVELEGLDHVGLNVADVGSIHWYQEVLGLTRVHEDAWGDFPAVLESNGTGVALFPRDQVSEASLPRDDTDMGHIGFRTSRRGLDEATAEIRGRGIEITTYKSAAGR